MSLSDTQGIPSNQGDPQADLSGRLIGDYKVLRRLGQGGMGQVYLAEQHSLKRKVALKFLRPDLASNQDSLQRFRNEAEAVAQATHPAIVQVYAIGESEGRHFMALEYVEGRNLREYLAFKGTLDLASAICILRQLVSALQRASELGIVHRDIKPENILLTRKGEAKIADFGLARMNAEQQALHLTQTGMTLGTPLYMAPEQVEGKSIDLRTDMYSLGITAYHMLSGKTPYQGENAFEVALKHLKGECPPLQTLSDIPVELCQLIHRMIQVLPASRPASFYEIQETLARISKGAGINQEVLASLPGISSILPAQDLTQAFLTTQFQSAPRTPFSLPWRKILIGFLFPASLGLGIWTSWILQSRMDDVSNTANGPDSEDEYTDLSRREKNLRIAAEQGLNPRNRGATNVTGVCMDLGLLYLGKHQIDEAEKLFTACVNSQNARDLGNLGMGIVLAVKDKPQESMEYFKKVPAIYVFNAANINTEMRYWLIEAMHYNLRNGVRENQVTGFLKGMDQAPNKGKNKALPDS